MSPTSCHQVAVLLLEEGVFPPEVVLPLPEAGGVVVVAVPPGLGAACPRLLMVETTVVWKAFTSVEFVTIASMPVVAGLLPEVHDPSAQAMCEFVKG
jgi:hypothetical protein